MHMSTKPRLASLYMQHLPHVKKQALAQRSYAHIYKTQTSLSLHATSSPCEETSSCPKIICTLPHMKKTSPHPKIICTLPHVKKQALAQRSKAHFHTLRNKPSPKDHMHMSTVSRLASLYVQHLPHVKKQALAQRSFAHVYKTQTSLSLHATSSTHEETSPHPKIICTCLQT